MPQSNWFARGGSSYVFAGELHQPDQPPQPVALKVHTPNKEEDWSQEVLQLARLSKLLPDHVVRFYGLWEVQYTWLGDPFQGWALVMERGSSLQEHIEALVAQVGRWCCRQYCWHLGRWLLAVCDGGINCSAVRLLEACCWSPAGDGRGHHHYVHIAILTVCRHCRAGSRATRCRWCCSRWSSWRRVSWAGCTRRG